MGGKIVAILTGLPILLDYDGSAAPALIHVLQSTRNECGKCHIFSHFFSNLICFIILFLSPLRMFSGLVQQLDGKNPSVDPGDEPDFYEQSIIPA